MISIRPEWCEKIASGKKTIEVRKSKPKLELPFKCYIYCTYGLGLIEFHDDLYPNMLLEQKVDSKKIWGNCCNGKVIGEFVCDAIVVDKTFGHNRRLYTAACMTPVDIAAYCVNSEMYGWHISELKIYDKPKELTRFIRPCPNSLYCESCATFSENRGRCFNAALQITRPPQSWMYVESWDFDG